MRWAHTEDVLEYKILDISAENTIFTYATRAMAYRREPHSAANVKMGGQTGWGSCHR